MNNLVLLNEVRREKMKNECKINLDGEEKLTNIIKKLFKLDNNKPLIDLLNEIYDDNLDEDTKFKYDDIKCESDLKDVIFLSNNNSAINITNDDKLYRIQFEVGADKQMSITILKCCIQDGIIKTIDPFIIMISSEINICDIYKLRLIFNKRKLSYRAKVFKNWKYNLKQLYDNNMYLLYPLKVFELEKRLLELKEEIDVLPKDIKNLPKKTKLMNLMKCETIMFFRSMNVYLNKLRNKEILDNEDISNFNDIAIEILKSFYSEIDDIYTKIDSDIQQYLKEYN